MSLLCRQPGNWKQYVTSYESDNAQAAGNDQVTIQSTADNEHLVNLMAPSNSDHTAVPLEEPTTPAL